MRLKAGTIINTLLEDSAGCIPVRLSETRALLVGHLNSCPVQVLDAALEGIYLFEPAPDSLHGQTCQFEVQLVKMVHGATNLFIEHRGGGPALELTCDSVLGNWIRPVIVIRT